MIGHVIGGRYRIQRLIGSGGMGAVYEALQLDLGRRVALKILPQSHDSVAIARFEREARAAAGLGHPHIVQVTELATHSDPPYLVMELLEGCSLGELVRREHPLSPERVVRIGLQIGSALAAAHQVGIVHRDIKPENVMLVASPAGDLVKLVDFGLAKSVVPGAAGPVSQSGVVIGTMSYMAPEQARGEPLDGRADLYAVAGTLYFALARLRPIEPPAGAPEHRLHAIVSQPPTPLRAHRPDVDERLAAIVMRGLAKDRAERQQSASELIAELEAWLAARGASIPPPFAAPPAELGAAQPTASLGGPTHVVAPWHPVSQALPSPSYPPQPSQPSGSVSSTGVLGWAVGLGGLLLGLAIAAAATIAVLVVGFDFMPGASETERPPAIAADAGSASANPPNPPPPAVSVSSSSSARSAPTPVAANTARGARSRKGLGDECDRHDECPRGTTCNQGKCFCSTWRIWCNNACVNLDFDNEHCGNCGTSCGGGTRCHHGKCLVCASIGRTDCNGTCIDTTSDTNHCGACNNACPMSKKWCSGGVCKDPSGPP